MTRIMTTPWARGLSPDERDTIATMLPPEYDVSLSARSPKGPYTAFLYRDRRRVDPSRSVGRTPAEAVRLALGTVTETVVVDGAGYIREFVR